ncbi:hypothetical protein DFH09DRAFT_1286053 [Mycena vulgaris]|nr:hypothetical protein DFH09DRAFT_1286053 [Mycena vulgaris]
MSEWESADREECVDGDLAGMEFESMNVLDEVWGGISLKIWYWASSTNARETKAQAFKLVGVWRKLMMWFTSSCASTTAASGAETCMNLAISCLPGPQSQSFEVSPAFPVPRPAARTGFVLDAGSAHQRLPRVLPRVGPPCPPYPRDPAARAAQRLPPLSVPTPFSALGGPTSTAATPFGAPVVNTSAAAITELARLPVAQAFTARSSRLTGASPASPRRRTPRVSLTRTYTCATHDSRRRGLRCFRSLPRSRSRHVTASDMGGDQFSLSAFRAAQSLRGIASRYSPASPPPPPLPSHPLHTNPPSLRTPSRNRRSRPRACVDAALPLGQRGRAPHRSADVLLRRRAAPTTRARTGRVRPTTWEHVRSAGASIFGAPHPPAPAPAPSMFGQPQAPSIFGQVPQLRPPPRSPQAPTAAGGFSFGATPTPGAAGGGFGLVQVQSTLWVEGLRSIRGQVMDIQDGFFVGTWRGRGWEGP